MRIADFVGSGDPGADGCVRVERFAEAPLRRAVLPEALGDVVADDAGSDAVRNRATAGAFELRLLDAGNVTSASAPAANPAAERDEIAAGRVVITAAAQSRIGASADAPLKLANGTALRTDVTARAGSVFLQQRGDARLVSGMARGNRGGPNELFGLMHVSKECRQGRFRSSTIRFQRRILCCVRT